MQGGGQNGVAQEEAINEPVGNSDQLSSSEIPNNQSVAEGDAPGQSGVYADNQGNPVDADGKLIVDEVNSIDEITDEDFETPTRNVQLPAIPENVAIAIGANGRPVVIKKNVFEKNGNTHVELEPEDSRNILRSALYNPNLVGSTQPIRRPDYKVAIRTGEQNAVVVLDVYQEKDFVEIVGWRMVNERGLAKMQRQAEREGGQFLILSPNDGSAAALSALPLGLSSESEDRNSVSNSQENAQESGEIAENGGESENEKGESRKEKEENAPEIQEPRSVEENLDNGDKRITNYNSGGEVATVAIERDGKIVSVDSYDEGVLFEHTEYDGNGKASSVTRYDKQGNVISTQRYVNGIESKAYVKETMRTAPLRARAEKWMKETGVPVRLIGIGEEITNGTARRAINAGEKVTGWIDNDEVVLYLPNIRNAKEIDDTFVHEVVAHKGLKALMGDDFNALCDKVWEMMSEEQRAYYLDYPGVNGDTRKAADEYMAHLAEGVDLTDADKTVWQRIVDAVREFLVKHGMKMTDRDIENLIKASYANLKSTEQRAQSKDAQPVAKQTKAEKYRKMREDLEGLRIGGEGMKGFYDKMLPSFVQKYTKKWGATVGEVTMPSLEENNTMWSADVTPEMQESVMQGQTMFRMGSRVDARMAEVAAHFEGKQLTAEQQAVVDVFGGKADNLTISVKTKDGNERRVVMRQGNEMGAGAKHSLFRHYGMNNGAITADDILLIPEILANGERVEKKRGKKTVIEYKYTDNNGVEYTVITENNKGREEFANFYTNRTASSAARKTRSEEARDTADDASEDKGSDNSSNTQEEETRFRRVEETSDGSIDDVPTQPLTLMERITNSLLEVSAKKFGGK